MGALRCSRSEAGCQSVALGLLNPCGARQDASFVTLLSLRAPFGRSLPSPTWLCKGRGCHTLF